MSKSTEAQIVEKLAQILKVLSIQAGSDMGLTERARLLKLAGLNNKTIANVMNVSVETVKTLILNPRINAKKRR